MSNTFTYRTICESPFGNTYGALCLIERREDGKPYLQMGDCGGSEYFGPLTPEQVAAFTGLCIELDDWGHWVDSKLEVCDDPE